MYMGGKRTVVIGFLGATLDSGARDSKRWEGWRPTVALCQQEDLVVDRLELVQSIRFKGLRDQVVSDIATISPETSVVSHLMEMEDAWDFEEVYGALLEFARSYAWNNEEEEYLLHITTGTHVAQICMFLLAEARYFPARLIQTSPPNKADRSPRGTYKIIDLDLSKYDRIASRFHKDKKDDLSFLKSGIETKNSSFNKLIERIERVAITSKEPLLLLGPTGAGKSQLARRIFELKKSRNQIIGDFIDVNCATIRGDAASSALFGHTKGAFTGAASPRNGLLVRAHKGILFLDEIGELGLEEQAMLLRAIEDKSFLPLGADKEVQSDFQLIAGTNRDLLGLCRQGKFREDLLARINLWSFTLPGLKKRPEDIPPNIDYELEKFSQRNNSRVSFNREARDNFLDFAVSPAATWSSNFRDLGSAITRMATLSENGRITEDGVAEEIERLRQLWKESDVEGSDAALFSTFDLSEAKLAGLDRFDRVQLLDVLTVCRDSRSISEAGRKLFAVSRETKSKTNDADRLRKYLGRFGIEWKGGA